MSCTGQLTWKMDSKVSLNLIKNWQSLCQDIVFSDIAPSLLQNEIITVVEYEHITSQSEPVKIENLLLLLLKKNEKVLLKFGDILKKDYSWLAEKLKEGCLETIKMESRDEVDATPIVQTDSCKSFENDTTEDEKDMCMNCNNMDSINRNHLNNRINIKSGKIERRRILKSRVKNRLKQKVQNSESVISSSTEIVKPNLNEEVTNEVITILKNCSSLSKSWTTIAHSLGLTDRVHDIRFKVIVYNEDLSMCIVHLIEKWLETFPKIATLSKLIEILRCENFNRVADQLTEILYRKPAPAENNI